MKKTVTKVIMAICLLFFVMEFAEAAKNNGESIVFPIILETDPQCEEIRSILKIKVKTNQDTRVSIVHEAVHASRDFFVRRFSVGAEADFPPFYNSWYDVPHNSLSPTWVPNITLEFGDGGLLGPTSDSNSTIGRGRILEHKVRFTVEKVANPDVLSITKLQQYGEVIDLYDFNYESGLLSPPAATLQIGYGKGSYGSPRDFGKVFRTKIKFENTATWQP